MKNPSCTKRLSIVSNRKKKLNLDILLCELCFTSNSRSKKLLGSETFCLKAQLPKIDEVSTKQNLSWFNHFYVLVCLFTFFHVSLRTKNVRKETETKKITFLHQTFHIWPIIFGDSCAQLISTGGEGSLRLFSFLPDKKKLLVTTNDFCFFSH